MKRIRYLASFIILYICAISLSQTVKAFPASEFTFQNGDWYDNFGIDRNNYAGPNGYLPGLAYETLNENKELAFSIGEQFLSDYSSQTERAAAILKFVQKTTEYGYDSDNVVRNGVPQEEWAWNADEMAHKFDETTGVVAVGDCEDMAFLCGTIYIGAGFDAAIIDAVDHVALLIWLPEFPNADHYWDLPNDDRDAGWIWVEATGSSNPLGWTPPDYENGGWTAYTLGDTQATAEPVPSQSDGAFLSVDMETMLVIVGIIVSILAALSRGRRR